jgi:tetratricopeptide (TPR) repeat protein
MTRTAITVGTAIALALTAQEAVAKPNAEAKRGTTITASELRACLGVDGSTPDIQIQVCTKVINSGKVKPPHHSDYYATRAAAYLAKGGLDEALKDINTAIGIRQAPEFYFQRGMINMEMRNWDEAKADFEKVTKLKDSFTPAHFMRGLVAYQMAEFKEALSHFDAALKRTPTYYQALFARGVTRTKLGDEAGGKKDISDARGMSDKVDETLAAFGVKP